jgi:ADP-heptose:LPS heptosyltransferase
MKILLIRLTGFAEALLITPLLRCLQQQQPTATVHVLTASENEAAFRGNPYLHKLHLYLHNVNLTDTLQQEAYTHVLDLQHDEESRHITAQLGITPLPLGRKSFGTWINEALGFQLLPPRHLVERYFATAAPLQVENDGRGLDFYVPSDAHTSAADIPASHHMGYVVLHLHAPHHPFDTKAVKIFCSKLPHPIILTGSLHEQDVAGAIALADPVKIYNACGKSANSSGAAKAGDCFGGQKRVSGGHVALPR